MLALLLLLASTGQEDDVLAARLRATVASGEADVRVELRYELKLVDENIPVPLRFLEVGGTRIENLTVNGIDRDLDRTGAPRVEAAALAPGGVLELTYDVKGAVPPDGSGVQLPVASVGVSQRLALPGTFRDDVTLPPEMEALERFPPGDELPVVPAFVAFGAMGPPAARGRDVGFVFWGLFAVFGLIVTGYLFWMRRVERRRA